MAGTIIADTIQAQGTQIRLNSASQTVATINASGLYSSTGNLMIGSGGTVVSNTAISGKIEQSQLGTNVAGTGPAFIVYRNSEQTSVSNMTATTVAFNTKVVDTHSFFSTSTYRYTPTIAGYYQFNWCVTVPNASNNTGLFTYLGRGGSTGSWTVNGSSGVGVGGQMWAYSSGSALVYMNGTDDYVIINVYGAGQASTFSLQANESKFEGFLARAA